MRSMRRDLFSFGPFALCAGLLLAFYFSETAGRTEPARLGREVTARVQGPFARNLSEGREVAPEYAGAAELVQLMRQEQAQPLAMAAADFDEDGAPDLVIGYASARGGIVSLLCGNIDAIYPNAPAARGRRAAGRFIDAPFLSPARLHSVPQAPDFIGAGDFDGDGHQDLAIAGRGGEALWLLAGDGRGGFASPKEISLPGAATAFIVGEINRRDGLEDLVVAVDGDDGPKALVYEGPTGALRARPEAFPLPASATALVLGQLDADSDRDLAVAAGRELLLIHGRDRRLSLGERERAAVSSARVTGRTISFAVRAMTAGIDPDSLTLLSEDGVIHRLASFNQESLADASALTATALSRAPGGIIAMDEVGHRVHLLAGREAVSLDTAAAPVSAIGMRLNAHARDSLVLLQRGRIAPTVLSAHAATTYTVSANDDLDDGKCDAAHCSLREAINAANANPGADLIAFDIQVKRALAPSLRNPLRSMIETMAPARIAAVFEIRLLSPLPDIIDSVTIDGTTQPRYAGTPLIQLTGPALRIAEGDSAVRGLIFPGIIVYSSVSTRSRSNYRIEGNFIGTDAAGTGVTSDAGISLFNVQGIVIGGSAVSARNLISGIDIPLGGQAGDIRIEGNFIGTDAAGANALDSDVGIGNRGSPGNRTQGLTIHRNLISGTASGIGLSYASDLLITGNFIGTDVSGTKAIPNQQGLSFVSTTATIGGTTPSARNVISGNEQWGIRAGRGATLQIQGNYIGLSASGTAAIPNRTGVEVYFGATIGGAIVAARNVISGNRGDGILVVGAMTTIQGNFIGTDAGGTLPVPNMGNGVILSQSSGQIGGPGENEGNLISANGENGVAIGPERIFPDEFGGSMIKAGGSDVTLQGNSIGTDLTGERPLGNQGNGIFWDNSTSRSRVVRNRIAFNKGSGVSIPNQGPDPLRPPGAQITMSENSIFSNGSIGIDLGAPGPTANQPPPPEKTQANDGQNFPEIARVVSDGVRTQVTGTLTSKPGTSFTLEFFNNPGTAAAGGVCKPEGKEFHVKTTVTTDERGQASFNVTYPKSTLGGFVNATATSAIGNTSEFSSCSQAQPQPSGPRLQEITVLPESITAIGIGFVNPVQVFVDEVAFEAPAIVEAGRTVTQRGKLVNGKGIAETIPPGKTVRIEFRNPDGGRVIASFRN